MPLVSKIKINNSSQFLIDIKKSSDVMVFAQSSGLFLKAYKCDVLREAESSKINYYLSTTIFINGREVMVVV